MLGNSIAGVLVRELVVRRPDQVSGLALLAPVVDPDALRRLQDDYALPGPLPEERSGTYEGPTLIVTGRQDNKVGYRDQLALAEHFPRLTLAMLDRAGHNVHLDQEGAVRGMVQNWAQDAARGR